MKTEIRDAQLSDLDAIVRLAAEYHSLSRFRDTLPFEAGQFREACIHALEVEDHFRVAEAGGEVVGFCHAARYMTLPWSRKKGWSEVSVFATPRHPGAAGLMLLRDLKRCAEKDGAAFILFAWMSGWRDERIMEVLARQGYEQIGHVALCMLD